MNVHVGDIVGIAASAIGAPVDQAGEVIGLTARKVRVEVWIPKLETHRVFTVWPKDVQGTDTNRLDCPEVRHYQRQALEGVIVVTYEQRLPGEAAWVPVRLVRVTETPEPALPQAYHSATLGRVTIPD